MKKNKSIIIVAILLVCMTGGYFLLLNYNKQKEEKKAADEAAAVVHITDMADLTDISYSAKKDESSGGEPNSDMSEVNLNKKDGKWVCKQDETVPIAQDKISTMQSAFINIAAVRELVEHDKLSDYGLDNPSYTIELKDEKDKSEKLYIGNEAGEDYYLSKDGSDSVYTVSSFIVESLKFSFDDLAQLDTMPAIGTGTLKKAEITSAKEKSVYTEDNADDITAIAGALGSVQLNKCENYHPSADDLKAYGLDEKERTTATYSYTESTAGDADLKTLTLYVGKKVEDGGSYYIMKDGSQLVYSVESESIDNILNKK